MESSFTFKRLTIQTAKRTLEILPEELTQGKKATVSSCIPIPLSEALELLRVERKFRSTSEAVYQAIIFYVLNS